MKNYNLTFALVSHFYVSHLIFAMSNIALLAI